MPEPSAADQGERLQRLFRAKNEGDVAYLIESLRLDPENVGLPSKWLAKMGETDAIPALVRLLDSPHPNVRTSAMSALYEFGPPRETKARLIEIARRDPDPVAQMWGAIDLGTFRDRSLVPLLVELLESPETGVRRGAAMALGETGDSVAVEPIRRALRRERDSLSAWYMNRHAYRKALVALRGPSPADRLRGLLGWVIGAAVVAASYAVILVLVDGGSRHELLLVAEALFGLFLVGRVLQLGWRLARRVLGPR